MAASRMNANPGRVCRRYRGFFYVCSVILCVQLYIGYSFYSMNQSELDKLTAWRREVDDRLKRVSLSTSTVRAVTQTAAPVKPDLMKQGRHGDQARDRTALSLAKCNTSNMSEVRSALNRAKTEQCKQELSGVACLAAQGTLYPPKLPRYCKYTGNFSAGHYLGCFKDEIKDRDLSSFNEKFKVDNTPQKCLDFCTAGSYMYAGVQFGYECWCGNSYGKHGALTEAACKSACPGDRSQQCGGYEAQRVFSTGLPEKVMQEAEYSTDLETAEYRKPVRIVFVLTVNGRAVRQVHRLVKALYHTQHYFYIHVDKRQEYMYRELLKLEETLPNVRLMRDRHSTIWGGASLLQAHLDFMESLLAMTDWAWDYYLNLSESDYPIKTIASLTAFLTKHRGYTFLKSNGRATPTFIRKQGLDRLFYECDEHMWRLGMKTLQTGILYDGGSDWICLHRDMCEYSVSMADPLVSGLKEMFKYVLLPVESFFHTLLLNSHLCDTWVDNNFHVTNWRRKTGCKCQQKAVVDWCGCSPNDFKPDDLPRLEGFKHKATFFGRKFEAIISNDILNEVDKFVFGPEVEETLSFNSFWQNDYHHLDSRSSNTDLQLTFYKSLVRQMTRVYQSADEDCVLDSNVKIIEAHVLYVADQFHRLLLLYNVSVGDSVVNTLESQYSLDQVYRVIDPTGPTGRLQHLQIGTNFDVKEMVFRNYVSLIGVDSDVLLRHVWGPGPSLTVAVAWIDPAGVIAAYSDLTILTDGTIETHKPKLAKPLRPGVWFVKLVHRFKVVAETKFVVLPSATKDDIPVTKHQVVLRNNGPTEGYSAEDHSSFAEVLQVTNTSSLKREAMLNGLRTGELLEGWIDDLTDPVWSVKDTCAVTLLEPRCPYFKPCQETSWSSKFPDPKSDITSYKRHHRSRDKPRKA